jgi:hypothetical protein
LPLEVFEVAAREPVTPRTIHSDRDAAYEPHVVAAQPAVDT